MNTAQNFTALIGVGLIGGNFWVQQHKTFAAGALNNNATQAQSAAAHTIVKTVALELLFVGVATLIAGGSSQAGSAMIAVMVALAIVWIIKYESGSFKPSTKGATK